jgi:phosphoribosylformylglycinamidine synthase
MTHRIEIRPKPGRGDPHARTVAARIRELGLPLPEEVRSARLYFLLGDLSASQADAVARELLVDPVVEDYRVVSESPSPSPSDEPPASPRTGQAVIEVHLQPGVMDPVASSVEQAVAELGIDLHAARTARRYELRGVGGRDYVETVARRLLANPVIEDIYYQAHTPPDLHVEPYRLEIVEVPLRDLDDEGLETLSADGHLFLDLHEMRAIRDHYRKLGREPRDVELETLAQTWSEHCVHKTFRSDVLLTDEHDQVTDEIPNLIKSTIFAATRKLDKPWCISVFEDNAGIIEFDDRWAVCFKVETHNHPSAIEPYGGAATGIGGVIRDAIGTGLGARPFANTDVFCFGPPDTSLDALPTGVLHPRRVMRGVVAGVRDYGNRMGIPTVNGAVYFDERYLGNPLVFCGTVGLIPRDKCFKAPRAGDRVVVVGGRTGRDGIHGATFSSGELTHQHETEFSHAVQIGNPITEKKMLDTILQARDEGLFSAITDCGAGGLSSAVGEMGEKLGAEVHLDRVPLKYQGLSYDEIWISEAQERMVLSVPPENVDRLMEIFRAEDTEATDIGHFGTQGRSLRLLYEGTLVGELDMAFLHDGLPRPTKRATWTAEVRPSPEPEPRDDWTDVLLAILAAPNVASKEWIIRQYDHEVQGGSVVKPLVGVGQDAPSDAAVVRPVLTSPKGVVISCGMNPLLGPLDAYQSALHAVDEALRNALAVGGDLTRTAILDNFCWGNCAKPDRMGALFRAARGCHDAAIAYGTPFVSGKDSLNNEFQTDTGETIAIPPTLLISAVSVIDDAARCVTSDLKQPGSHLYLLGASRGELGGSHLLRVLNAQTGNDVPPVDCRASRAVFEALQPAIESGLVRSCHDLSEGGLAVAAAEMAMGGRLGVRIDLDALPVAQEPPLAARLFGEAAGRFLVEVAPSDSEVFAAAVADIPARRVGEVTDDGRVVLSAGDARAVDCSVARLLDAWRGLRPD